VIGVGAVVDVAIEEFVVLWFVPTGVLVSRPRAVASQMHHGLDLVIGKTLSVEVIQELLRVLRVVVEHTRIVLLHLGAVR